MTGALVAAADLEREAVKVIIGRGVGQGNEIISQLRKGWGDRELLTKILLLLCQSQRNPD